MKIPARLAVHRSGLENQALDVDGVRIVRMPRIVSFVVGRKIQAITVNRMIMVHPEMFDAVASGEEPTLLVHELMHVSQFRKVGVVDFVVRYLAEYLRLRMIGVPHDAAYRGISFEHAAFDAADRYDRRAA